MLFESYYGMSFIPTLRDMTQQAVGVYQAGGPPRHTAAVKPGQEPVIHKELSIPERVTLAWLFKHVPVHLWAAALGVIAAVFVLGIKAAHWPFVKEVLSQFGAG